MGKKGSRRRGGDARSAFPVVVAYDLFCGAGGLTRGLERAGIRVKLGVDIDPACRYPYTKNNRAKFLLKSVADLSAEDLTGGNSNRSYRLLAGCAPCQPFSSYKQKVGTKDERWRLLEEFERLADELDPDFITMENVPNLQKQKVFKAFVAALATRGFHVSYEVVDCANFGVPQQRRRLVLLASKLGPITLVRPKKEIKPKTVKQAIGKLPRLRAGSVSSKDPLHQSCELSELNLRRIRASKPGGSWRDWDDECSRANSACPWRKPK
jgi:DNA (cytosine-5)-methyltransferase 1